MPAARLLPRLATLVLTSTAALSAQPERPVDCRLLWFDHGAPPALVHVGEGGAEVRCPLVSQVIAAPVRLTAAAGSIVLLHEAGRAPAATAQVPPATRRAILVLVPAGPPAAGAAPAQQPLRVFVIDDSPARFPDGGAFVGNFYRQDIRFIIGEHRNLLRPGSGHALPRPRQRDPFNMAPVVVQFQQDAGWRTVSESTVRFIPGVRHLILACVDPASGRPRIATFPDVQPTPPPPR